jgi:hypothetical protein
MYVSTLPPAPAAQTGKAKRLDQLFEEGFMSGRGISSIDELDGSTPFSTLSATRNQKGVNQPG